MPYQPAENLNNRTFVGLIVAQFLAGFNDQAIHAAAMFYAIHTKILSQSNAITLMPILFYSPWAIFCTLSGYYADRYSKTLTLRIWKASEIVISLMLIAGFYFGTNADMPRLGGWIVMASVFLMGTHAAFFAPAKYGAMPEILKSDVLSKGNGILESTTFLASIFGSVSGGLLFHTFRDNPVMIGVILLGLSIFGAAASFMIAWLPAASPERPFPVNQIKPLVENLRLMFRSRPLALAVLGIAFFVFMVSYMRASMYMHGETRNPRWDEEKTSLIVATVALGVGLGSPLAGYLSGGKVELGLVPLGCVGMIVALLISAVAIEHTGMLVVALIMIGFFSGFYMVPLYTMLQQRAPKKSKGELVATSNFINVTGAIAASILFAVLVYLSQVTRLTPPVDYLNKEYAVGVIKDIVIDKNKIQRIVIKLDIDDADIAIGEDIDEELLEQRVIDTNDSIFDLLSGVPQKGDAIIVSSYVIRDRLHYVIQKKTDNPTFSQIYDKETLPSYLFYGAALMTMGILIALRRKLPDFFVRTVFWYQSLGKYRLKVVGMQHLPTEGPVVLATNARDLKGCLQLISATDRTTKVVLIEDPAALQNGSLLLWMARNTNLILIRPDHNATEARAIAMKTLDDGHLLAVSIHNEKHANDIATLLGELQRKTGAPILPVYCGSLDADVSTSPRVRVVFGEMKVEKATDAHDAALLQDCVVAIGKLGDWIRDHDDLAGMDAH